MMALDGKLSYYSLYRDLNVWTEFYGNQCHSCGDISLKSINVKIMVDPQSQ